jgi:hypothetical protein
MHLHFYTQSHPTLMSEIVVAVLMAVKACVLLVCLSLQEDRHAKCKVNIAALTKIQVLGI